MTARFAWNELATTDPAGAKAFYEATLGWRFEEFALPDGAYWVAIVDGQPIAGLGGMETGALGGEQSYWFSFIEVDDIDARLAEAVRLGATIIQPAHDVPNVGRVAVLRDPFGAAIGWMTGIQPGA